MQPRFIIYSHGFGVRKDDMGLLSNIADSLASDAESLLFDYNEVNETEKSLTVHSISVQAKMLNTIIEKTRELHPEAIIDLIAHSQGTVVAAFAAPAGIRKAVFLSPVFDMTIERTLKRYAGRPGAEIDLEGMSKLPSVDGYIRYVPAEYWKERAKLETFELYNKFAEQTELILINANQDQLLGSDHDLARLNSNIQVQSLDGDHNFSGDDREPLLQILRKLLVTSN